MRKVELPRPLPHHHDPVVRHHHLLQRVHADRELVYPPKLGVDVLGDVGPQWQRGGEVGPELLREGVTAAVAQLPSVGQSSNGERRDEAGRRFNRNILEVAMAFLMGSNLQVR